MTNAQTESGAGKKRQHVNVLTKTLFFFIKKRQECHAESRMDDRFGGETPARCRSKTRDKHRETTRGHGMITEPVSQVSAESQAWMHGTCVLTIPPPPLQLVGKIACVKIDNPSTAARSAVVVNHTICVSAFCTWPHLESSQDVLGRLRGGRRAQGRVHPSIYIYIYMVPPPRAYLCTLLVEGVNSTLCASFLQMLENTVTYSVFVVFLPSM